MRILYLNYEWDPRESTGAFTHIRELSRGLTALGHTVQVVDRHRRTADAGPGGEADDSGRGKTGLGHTLKSGLRPWLHESAALARAWKSLGPERDLLRLARPDVVLVRHSLHQFSGHVAARRCGVPVVCEVNAPAAYEYRRYRSQYRLVPGFAEWLEARMLAKADGMFVVSEMLKRHFVDRGVRADRIRVVPNGADIARFHPGAGDPAVRERLGRDSVIVGFVGSFATFHGIEQLQHAIDVLCRNRPEVRFLLVGAGEMSEGLRSHCARQGLGGRVHFSGHVPPEQVPPLMAAADILMAPYAAQDFFYLSPIKIFEYMAVGRAVLAARVGQIGEVIEDGVTGLLYDPSDPASLSTALLRLVGDEALRRRLGESARRTVEERYTWQANARAVAGLLEDVIERRRASRTLVGAPGRMGRALRSLRCDLSRVRLEAPAGARHWAGMKRTAKIAVALLCHSCGLTGPLLRRLLRSRRAAVVLGYHGLTSESRGLLDAGHAVEEVAGLLRYLSRHLTPIPLEALAGPVAAGQPPPPATFAVTFDDGMLNNVTLAVPLLKDLGLSATFFIPSGLVGSQEDLWVARLREVIRTMPGDSIPAEPGLWPDLPLGEEASRYATLFRIKQTLKAHEGGRREVLLRLAERAGGPRRPPEENRVVGPDALRGLAGGGIVVGAHSRSHPILSGLDEARARDEISGSRQDLERLLGTQVTVFAFPNGRFDDFNESTLRLVAEAGYRIALTTEPGVVKAGDDPLALRRCVPENVPAFLTAFDLLLKVWKDRDRPPDAARPLRSRITHLGGYRTGAAA